MRAIIFVRHFSDAFRRGAEKASGPASGIGMAAGAIVLYCLATRHKHIGGGKAGARKADGF